MYSVLTKKKFGHINNMLTFVPYFHLSLFFEIKGNF